MVLRQPLRSQRQNVVLWGWVPDRQYVSVQLPGTRLLRPEHASDGRLNARQIPYRLWLLRAAQLPEPMPTNGPFSLTLRVHKSRPGESLKKPEDVLDTQEITNVIMGSVWTIRVLPDRGSPHQVRPASLSPRFRVLRLSDLVWDGRSPELIGRVGTGGWQVPAEDPAVLEALPGLAAYAGLHWFEMDTRPALGLGIILVDHYPGEEMKDREALIQEDSLMKKAVAAAFEDCGRDQARNEPERLRLKRRGISTRSLGLRQPTASVSWMRPPARAEFCYDVDGFFW